MVAAHFRVKGEKNELTRFSILGQQEQPWYEQITGSFDGDKVFAEIIRLGRLIRAGKEPK